MKEKLKLIGIIALVAVIGLAMTACGGDPCLEGHEWGDWDTDGESSIRQCAACGEEEYCYHENYGNWTKVGTTTAANRTCPVCSKVETLAKHHFYGSWKHTTDSGQIQTIVISANSFELTTTAGASNYYRYTGTNLIWTAVAFDQAAATDTVTNAAINSATFPVGFALTGGSTAAEGTWGANTGPAWAYMKTTGDAIVVRLTSALVSRTYTFTPAQ